MQILIDLHALGIREGEKGKSPFRFILNESSALENGGRKYGGGLKEIEPKELGEVFVNLQLD